MHQYDLHQYVERVVELLFTLVTLGVVLERALSLLFESRFFIKRFSGKSLKEVFAFAAAMMICWFWRFDVIKVFLEKEFESISGTILTAAAICGFAKVSEVFLKT